MLPISQGFVFINTLQSGLRGLYEKELRKFNLRDFKNIFADILHYQSKTFSCKTYIYREEKQCSTEGHVFYHETVKTPILQTLKHLLKFMLYEVPLKSIIIKWILLIVNSYLSSIGDFW